MSDTVKCNLCGVPISSQTAMSAGDICPGCLLLGGLTEAEQHDDPAGSSWNPDALLGKRVGPYTIEEKIGEGGSAVVYRASQEEPVARTVAFKLIKPGMDSEAILARFDAERQVLARMDHPSIATILDAGRTPEGRPFFVMEHVEGLPLTAFCRKHQLGQRQKLDLFLEICRGMEHAHQRGVIHRDIKPSNILATLIDKKPQPKIIDFGIARATDGQFDSGTLFVTRQHEVVGTPAYMSPEQAEGQRDEIDTRTDVYQLGVLLYELLTGSLPFDFETEKTLSFTSILEKIRHEDPRRPSQVKVGLHHDLDAITMKAMDKERNRRYSGVAEFASDIRRHLADEPVLARPPSFAYRSGKFIRKHRVEVTTATMIAAAMIAGTAISVWQKLEADKARDEADQSARRATISAEAAREAERRANDSAQRAREEAAISKAVNRFLNDDLLKSASARMETDRKLTVREALDRAADTIGDRFQDQPRVEASLLRTIADAYESLGEYDRALPIARRGLDLAERLYGKIHPETVEHLRSVAAVQLWRGEVAEARATFEDVIARQTELTGEESGEVVLARHDLAVSIAAMGEYEKAEAYYRVALEDTKRLFGESSSKTIRAMHNYSGVLMRLGRKKEGLAIARKVLEANRSRYPEDHIQVIESEVELSRRLHATGETDEALRFLEKAIASSNRGLDPSHPVTLLAMQNKADILDDLGRVDEAIAIWKEVVRRGDVESRNLGPEMLVTLNNLALRIASRGESELATTYLRRVAAQRRANYGPYNRTTLTADYNLAIVLRDTGSREEAAGILRSTLLAQRVSLGNDDPETLKTLEVLSRLLLATGADEEAIELLATGLKDASASNHSEAGQFASLFTKYLARASERLGKSDEVIRHFSRWVNENTGNGGAWLSISQALAQRAINSKIEKGSIVSPRELKERKGDSNVSMLCAALAFSLDHIAVWEDGASALRTAAAHTSFLPIIGPDTNWKFFDGAEPPGIDWNQPGYDDSQWVEGFPEFGYGDYDEATTIRQGDDSTSKPITAWFRFSFDLSNLPAENQSSVLCLIADDGAVVYLNGRELIRHNMPTEGEITPTTLASTPLSDLVENHVHLFPIDRSSFRRGMNVLAVEVHQSSPRSSDMSFYPMLFTDTPNLKMAATTVTPEEIDQIFPEAGAAAAVLKALRLEALGQRAEADALLAPLNQEDPFISRFRNRLRREPGDAASSASSG